MIYLRIYSKKFLSVGEFGYELLNTVTHFPTSRHDCIVTPDLFVCINKHYIINILPFLICPLIECKLMDQIKS